MLFRTLIYVAPLAAFAFLSSCIHPSLSPNAPPTPAFAIPGVVPDTMVSPSPAAAKRIIYILDHSKPMSGGFAFAAKELEKVVTQLNPEHSLAVFVISDKVDAVFPANLQDLAPVTPQTQLALSEFLKTVAPSNASGDVNAPVLESFKKAFALHAQIIYLVTNDDLSPETVQTITRLNQDSKTRIWTVTMFKISEAGEKALKDLAADNDGKFKFVQERDLEK